MKSEILKAPSVSPVPVVRTPAIYRFRGEYELIWLVTNPTTAICLFSGPGVPNGGFAVGDILDEPLGHQWPSNEWERLTGPIDIRFTP